MLAIVSHSRKASSFLVCGIHGRNNSVNKLWHWCLFPLKKYDPVCASILLPHGTGRTLSLRYAESFPHSHTQEVLGSERSHVSVTGSRGHSEVQVLWT